MFRVARLNRYVDWAEPEDSVLVFDSFEDYAKEIKHGRAYIEYFKNHEDAPCAPIILKFVHNEEEAREFVKKAIEAGDEDYRSVQQYADEQHYEDGAYGVLIGEWDGCNRFSFTKQGYLLDNPLFD